MFLLSAENEYINGIARIKFGWEGKEWGRFYSFGTFSALVGKFSLKIL
jgi:hypothetical protein